MKSDFQLKLEEVVFKTGLHTQDIGYADLFANKRVVVLATPKPVNGTSYRQMKAYEARYDEIKSLGIDDIYCVSSDLLLLPYMARHSDKIIPILDTSYEFVKLMQAHASSNPNLMELARMWEYVVIINNGSLEKIFSNPLKEGMPLVVYNHETYRFRKLGPEYIISYLGNVAQ